MAGIGFELRKVLRDHKFSNRFWGYTASLSITTGPMIISIIQLLVIDRILRKFNVISSDIEIIKATIMYAYVFSMIITSGFIIVITRYLADKLYENDTKDILSSFIGIVSILLSLGGVISILFYIRSSLTFDIKLISHVLFMEMIVLYTIMCYISIIKDVKKVAIGYVMSFICSILLTILLLYINLNPIIAVLSSVVIGYFINILILIKSIALHFQTLTPSVYLFVPYFKNHYRLFLTNLFYTVGIFIHNIIFWKLSTLTLRAGEIYVYAPIYDTASFFAVLTTIPASIIFVIRFETVFYEKYKIFCDTLEIGTLRDLRNAKTNMIKTLDKEFSYIMQIQFITTTMLIALGFIMILLELTNDIQTIGIYAFLAIGFFMSYMIFINIIILIYFDLQSKSLLIASLFLSLNIVLTIFTIYMGGNFYGLGYAISGFLVFIISRRVLSKELKEIDYKLFTK